MPERQSDPPEPVSVSKNYYTRQRAYFSEGINRRAREEGINDRNRTTWLRDLLRDAGEPVRWQTVQDWFKGESYPGPVRAGIVARVLGMSERDLILQIEEEEDDPEWWRAFLRTPDAVAMTTAERQLVRFFPWPKPPNNADCRALLAVFRNNAERAHATG